MDRAVSLCCPSCSPRRTAVPTWAAPGRTSEGDARTHAVVARVGYPLHDFSVRLEPCVGPNPAQPRGTPLGRALNRAAPRLEEFWCGPSGLQCVPTVLPSPSLSRDTTTDTRLG